MPMGVNQGRELLIGNVRDRGFNKLHQWFRRIYQDHALPCGNEQRLIVAVGEHKDSWSDFARQKSRREFSNALWFKMKFETVLAHVWRRCRWLRVIIHFAIYSNPPTVMPPSTTSSRPNT